MNMQNKDYRVSSSAKNMHDIWWRTKRVQNQKLKALMIIHKNNCKYINK